MRTLDTMKNLYCNGYFADDTESDGETFREVVERLDALDEIRPAPRTTAPTMRLCCISCGTWFDGLQDEDHIGGARGVCSFCHELYRAKERDTIERNRHKPPTQCTLCGAESRTFVCESCDKRPPVSSPIPFDYRSIERRAADDCGGVVAETYGSQADGRAFCENCGAALPALFKDDGTPLGVNDCLVCEGLPTVWGSNSYCRRCGSRKVRLSLIRKGCPYCG